jgi:hypothetical protein
MRFNGTYFIENPPEFSIDDDGVACVRIVEGDMALEILCSPNTLRASAQQAVRAFAEWEAKQRSAE